jgi:hypothetical protein
MFRTRELSSPFQSSDQESLSPETHEYKRTSEVGHHLTGKHFAGM